MENDVEAVGYGNIVLLKKGHGLTVFGDRLYGVISGVISCIVII